MEALALIEVSICVKILHNVHGTLRFLAALLALLFAVATLVAAQDDLVAPRRWFEARPLPEPEPS